MFLGIDLGTSAVKVALVDDERIVDAESVPLEVERPRPLWSEQSPRSWWEATERAVARLGNRVSLAGVSAIGLSGQMHGATLLDRADRPLRPAILWNDGRASRECAELEERVPNSRELTGNLAMPGFTAPKLLWVQEHEPDVFERTASVLLPKDYLRLCMTGDSASDLSDASGTLWLDVAHRAWSEEMLDACRLTPGHMPVLFEGTQPTGNLRPDVARDWGMRQVPVAAGAGDQAAGAVGAGVVRTGEGFLSLGTSGVYFVCDDRYRPAPELAVHAFCHCLPERWHRMSVILSAASCLSWAVRLTGAADESELLAEIERADRPCTRLLFLPYLSGERTPHNDPDATGVVVGLTHDTDRAELGRAVLEGVAFALADAQTALSAGAASDAGAAGVGEVSVIGGGARSRIWGRILASVLRRPLTYRAGGDVGPAFGAARLARLSVSGESADEVCVPPPVDRVVEPDPKLADLYARRLPEFRSLYARLKGDRP